MAACTWWPQIDNLATSLLLVISIPRSQWRRTTGVYRPPRSIFRRLDGDHVWHIESQRLTAEFLIDLINLLKTIYSFWKQRLYVNVIILIVNLSFLFWVYLSNANLLKSASIVSCVGPYLLCTWYDTCIVSWCNASNCIASHKYSAPFCQRLSEVIRCFAVYCC